AQIFARQSFLDELDAVGRGQGAPLLVRIDDGDAFGRTADVAQDQRQHALTDGPKADDDDASRKILEVQLAGHDLSRYAPRREGTRLPIGRRRRQFAGRAMIFFRPRVPARPWARWPRPDRASARAPDS